MNENIETKQTDSKLTLLIVEDEDILQNMLEKILIRLGYEVIKASDGKEGVDLFKEHKDIISGVILDMRMPVMNGREAFLEMKKIKDDVRVLLSTGYGSNDEAQEIIDMGASGLLSKPYHMKELTEKLKIII